MSLILIIGPMKSGKSFELINYFAPLKYTDEKFGLFHPIVNVRDDVINSRNGTEIQSTKINSLQELLDSDFSIIGIDEVHMFSEGEADFIEELINRGVKLVISGLDLDHRGEMFPIIKRIFELVPHEVKHKRAVCECCKSRDAVYTQVLKDSMPLGKDMPASVPDDGTFEYLAVCRKCFRK